MILVISKQWVMETLRLYDMKCHIRHKDYKNIDGWGKGHLWLTLRDEILSQPLMVASWYP